MRHLKKKQLRSSLSIPNKIKASGPWLEALSFGRFNGALLFGFLCGLCRDTFSGLFDLPGNLV